MIGRAAMEGSKGNVAMSAPAAIQDSYACGGYSDKDRAGRVGNEKFKIQ